MLEWLGKSGYEEKQSPRPNRPLKSKGDIKMAKSLRSIKTESKRATVAARRIASESKGLGYWGAKDSLRGAIVRPIKADCPQKEGG